MADHAPTIPTLFPPADAGLAGDAGPADSADQESAMRARVDSVLDMIRPAVQADGGDIELVDVAEGVVQIRLAGACVGCMYSMMTLQAGIERMLKEYVPEVRAVEAVPF